MTRPAGRLLVVDEDERSRDLLYRQLQQHAYEITCADNGQRALDLVKQHPFDLVLLDVMLPDLSGLEVLRRLRQTHGALELPVVMVTARTQSETEVQAFHLGANDYLTKPIDFSTTLARLATHLSLKKSHAALRESEGRYALAVRGTNDGLWDWDLHKDEVYYSCRWKEMLGHQEDEIGTGPKEWFDRVHPLDRSRVEAEIAAHCQGLTPHHESEHRMLHKDGGYRWMSSRGLVVQDAGGQACRMAGSLTDITLGKVADALTGLPNRALFMDRLGRALDRARRSPDYRFALLFLDLDRFKVINDSLGHVVGDQLLLAIARRLEACLRSSDTIAYLQGDCTVARLGGDEFTILLDGIKHADNAISVAERIQRELTLPFNLSGHEVFTSASIGIALGVDEYECPEDLLRDADTALYCAKAQGKARYEVFDTAMRARAVARMQLEIDLRRALERQELCLQYQPILNLADERIIGFEALVRWRHPQQGLIPPSAFMSLAEETGLIVPLGWWVCREACRQMSVWQQRFPADLPLVLCVNLSSKQFSQTGLVEQIQRLLSETGLDPGSLNLEITESAISSDPEAAAGVLREFRALGVRMSIDDFGTGYSCLSRLHRFPVDALKIDRSFVSQIGSAGENITIVQAIVMLAHNLGMAVVAEGVETAAQRDRLGALQCEYGQGYLFSGPVDAEAATALLEASASAGSRRQPHPREGV